MTDARGHTGYDPTTILWSGNSKDKSHSNVQSRPRSVLKRKHKIKTFKIHFLSIQKPKFSRYYKSVSLFISLSFWSKIFLTLI